MKNLSILEIKKRIDKIKDASWESPEALRINNMTFIIGQIYKKNQKNVKVIISDLP